MQMLWLRMLQDTVRSRRCAAEPATAGALLGFRHVHISVTYLQNVRDATEIYHIVHKGVHGEDGKVGA